MLRPPHFDKSGEGRTFAIVEMYLDSVQPARAIVANSRFGKPSLRQNAHLHLMVASARLKYMFAEGGVSRVDGSTTALPPTQDEPVKLLTITLKYGFEILPSHS